MLSRLFCFLHFYSGRVPIGLRLCRQVFSMPIAFLKNEANSEPPLYYYSQHAARINTIVNFAFHYAQTRFRH